MKIPVNDPSRYLEIKRAQLLSATEGVIDAGILINGSNVSEFEDEFRRYLGANFVVGVANGTDALEIALRTVGVGRNDLVLLAPNAGMYAHTAINQVGALPVYVDIDSKSLSLDVHSLEELINRTEGRRFSALVLTHLYGLANQNVERIAELCKASGIELVEDCAQAHGAKVNSRCVGTFGRLATFSFYPTKNLGALGDGGAIAANKASDETLVRSLAQYGWGDKYEVVVPGGRNSRLDELQAAYLRMFLPDLNERNSLRQQIAARYSREITNSKISIPNWSGENYVAHLFVVMVSPGERKNFRDFLKTNGVSSEIHYPYLDTEQPALSSQGVVSPVMARDLNSQIVTLPCFPELTQKEVEFVIGVCNAWT